MSEVSQQTQEDHAPAKMASKDSVTPTSKDLSEREIEPEIIEVVTPGASALQLMAAASSGNTQSGAACTQESFQDLDRALETVLAFYGWQHIEVHKVSASVFSLAGSEFMLRCDAVGEQPTGGPPCRLLASSDGGQTWDSLALLIRNRRLHKVVRTAPIPATHGIPPNPDGQEGLDYERGEMLRQPNQAPISLDDLARMSSSGRQPQSLLPLGAREARTSIGSGTGSSGYGAYRGNTPSAADGLPRQSFRNGLPLGPDGLPTHLQNGLPSFNNAFPNYFDALSGPTHYYNQFRIPDRQTQ
jgi:hypothetical protein